MGPETDLKVRKAVVRVWKFWLIWTDSRSAFLISSVNLHGDFDNINLSQTRFSQPVTSPFATDYFCFSDSKENGLTPDKNLGVLTAGKAIGSRSRKIMELNDIKTTRNINVEITAKLIFRTVKYESALHGFYHGKIWFKISLDPLFNVIWDREFLRSTKKVFFCKTKSKFFHPLCHRYVPMNFKQINMLFSKCKY